MAAIAPRKRQNRSRGAKPRNIQSGALTAYRGKRNFQKTSEPAGRVARAAGSRFVVQKHAATRLHYDLRLEIGGGVLKSWAVPKEIPLRAGEKALAIMVEDHPVEYEKFEGTIPNGQYGAGTVMLWDRGTYRTDADDAAAALAEGKIHLHFAGKKLRGEWALVKMRREENQWLLIKAGDNPRPSAGKWDLSAATGRTMEEIAATRKMWNAKASKEPAFVVPMKAKPVKQLPSGSDWLYELKFDGYRFLATKGGNAVHLWSRTEHDLSARFSRIAQAIRELPCATAILDGELVVSDERGRPSFQLIQNAGEKTPVQAFVFDLLHLDGDDLRHLPLDERRARLARLVADRPPLHFSPALKGEAREILAMVTERGLEGIVAKRRSSRYEPGQRSGAWAKMKCALEQEFVIGGFTAPEGTRSHFGSLLIGYFRGKKLIFAGRVGTGFDQTMLASLHRQMRARRIDECPFASLPTDRSRWKIQFTRAELTRCTWVKPELVAQVRFAEWTADGVLRQPAFLGLRDDKTAREVRRET